ncbi:MAG: phosphatase PAP2 family protein [Patescibacteria group bacterium]|nr:phosphatase PAP2 family protein [Patescibacteria group bacterium]
MRLNLRLCLLSLLSFFLFCVFTYLVISIQTSNADLQLTTLLQQIVPNWLAWPFSLLSLIGTAELTFIVWATLLLFVFLRKHILTFFSLFLYLGGLLAEITGKLLINHPGPPSQLYKGVIHLELPSSFVQTAYSYPSGHMVRMTFLIVFLFCLFDQQSTGKTKIVAKIGLTGFLILMAISRVYLAEHWTSDVVGGILLGLSLGLLAASTLPKQPSTTH